MEKSNPEIEAAILGACLNDENAFIKTLEKCVAEDFYNSINQKVFNSMVECFANKNNVNYLVVINIAKKYKIAPSYITELMESSVTSSTVNALINELLNYRVIRERNKLADDIKSGVLVTDEDIRERLKLIEFINSKIGNDNTITTLDKIKITDIYKAEKIPTGFKDIDKRILGFVMGSLIIITGYNGNGKSTLINQMCIAESLSKNYKVFAYSPELTNSNFKSWLYPTIADSDHFITKQNFAGEQYKSIGDLGIKYIDNWIKDKLFIYTDDSITHKEKQLLNDMNRLAQNGVKVFVIDNLMKIELEGSYKNELLAQKEFVNKLKEFARKYNCIVHLVAHPRKPKDNSSKISKFDIAGSGDITNLADYVLSISRVTDEQREKQPALKDSVIKIMKDRIKGTSEFIVNLNYDKVRKRFYHYNAELNKSYGYANNMVQVEVNENVF